MFSVATKPRTKWIIALAVILVLMGAYVAPLLHSSPEQDACSFGPVSNERYGELLAEAKRRQATNWPRLVWDDDKAANLLNDRFDDLSRGMTIVYDRLAAMHAIIRALGGDYRRTGYDDSDPYAAASRGSGIVPFEYNVDVNRLSFFAPLWRQSWVIGSIVVGDRDIPSSHRHRPRLGDISFLVRFPAKLDSYPVIPRSALGESCPRLPNEQLADRLNTNPTIVR
jgi:hypothetical protein